MLRYRLKLVDEEWTAVFEAKELSVEEGVLAIEYLDGTVEWIPLSRIDRVLQGTNQPWTKLTKVRIREESE